LLAGAAYQGTFVISTLVSLPFITRALSPEAFGVLATLTAVPVLTAFADLGIGSALVGRLAEARGRDDLLSARSAVATALAAAVGAGILVATLGGAAALALPWESILGADGLSAGDVRAAVFAAALVTGFSVPAMLGQRILYGMHRGGSANRWLSAGIVLAATLGVVCATTGAPLAAYVVAMMGAPTLVGLLCLTWTLAHERSLRPQRSFVTRAEFSALRGSSSWFFLIDVASVVGYQTDVFVVASVLGARDAGVYSVCLRVFGLITASLTPALLQLWPAFADAYVRGDASWIRSRLTRSVLLGGFVGSVASLLLVLLGPALISTWLTSSVTPPRTLMLACALWTVYQLLNAPFFLLMNATNRARVHAQVALLVASVNLPLSVWLAFTIGLPGPALGSFLAAALVQAVPGVMVTRRLFQEPMFIGSAVVKG
jgi:O-antigen/teichoic acid export membrane protein